jgi:hypothetical protein
MPKQEKTNMTNFDREALLGYPSETFRYDLARWNGPRLVLITEAYGKRSSEPLLGTVVLPSTTQDERVWR